MFINFILVIGIACFVSVYLDRRLIRGKKQKAEQEQQVATTDKTRAGETTANR